MSQRSQNTKRQWALMAYLAIQTSIVMIYLSCWAIGWATASQAIRGFAISTVCLLCGLVSGYALARLVKLRDARRRRRENEQEEP